MKLKGQIEDLRKHNDLMRKFELAAGIEHTEILTHLLDFTDAAIRGSALLHRIRPRQRSARQTRRGDRLMNHELHSMARITAQRAMYDYGDYYRPSSAPTGAAMLRVATLCFIASVVVFRWWIQGI